MQRAGNTDVRDEQTLSLDARGALQTERAKLMADFEKQLRRRVDDRIAGRREPKADFAKMDASSLTLVENTVMEEAVLTGNISRVVENLCYDELQTLNRGMGQLLGDPDLETDANPLAPSTIVNAFATALKSIEGSPRVKFAILKELNQASLSEINAIYADVNQHLANLRVVPLGRSTGHLLRSAGERKAAAVADTHAAPQAPPPSAEVDIMALFRRMFGGAPVATSAAMQGGAQPGAGAMGTPAGYAAGSMPAEGSGFEFPAFDLMGGAAPVAHRYIPAGPLPMTAGGYMPGAPIIVTPELGEGLARLQRGESGFDIGGGAYVQFSGIPDGQHNVLRDLQESPLGKRANQLESMTIELVAMLFDFVFETKDLPDGIKALLARLQIPVLKAAMLDGAFFAKKSHPSRLLVNELAQAGLGWSPEMGQDDPLYRKLDEIVHRILDDFADNLDVFEQTREELRRFLTDEERAAEANIQTSADEINERDRRQIAQAVVRAEVERRIESYPLPQFLAAFLRERWSEALERTYLAHGEDSDPWAQGLATLEDLVWSVQPKKTAEDRKHLVALLPSLLKRLSSGLAQAAWEPAERESFMANLVEAHAAAVKPSLSSVPLPTSAVAEQAKVDAEHAKAAGDEAAAARAEQLAAAMAMAEPLPEAEVPEVIEDHFLEIAQSLERGMWVEFEGDDGQLAFAKLAWVSPLRGTYLFTNRQGQKALSMTAEELAERFRLDRARLVEAEPLVDRAFSSMMASITEKFPEPAAA